MDVRQEVVGYVKVSFVVFVWGIWDCLTMVWRRAGSSCGMVWGSLGISFQKPLLLIINTSGCRYVSAYRDDLEKAWKRGNTIAKK